MMQGEESTLNDRERSVRIVSPFRKAPDNL